MGSQLNPYIMYNGNARQAMEFYREVFGGELEMGTAADFGSPDLVAADKIMHAMLETPQGYVLNAWDAPEGMPYQEGNNVAIYIGGSDTELRTYFEKLSAGGTVTMPLETQAWGDEAGSLIDQFGINWMFNITAR
ncbi:VOC family protein [Nesterenkonia ebinurensis]|uniref:VOC family protein n=1 Tax=Nesterenkonia ebinurensis TaxID=2608252 RepID=UPI00123C8E5D|nr:VOC family protein [Nesterenkonia ebinurensis]